MSKQRPKAVTSSKAPKKATKRKLSAAQLKARNVAHRKASKRATATARARAQAKIRAAQKAAAARRAAAKTQRSHTKNTRFYCQVSTRGAATVSKPSAASQVRNRAVQKSPSARALHGVKAYRRPKPVKGLKPAKTAKG